MHRMRLSHTSSRFALLPTPALYAQYMRVVNRNRAIQFTTKIVSTRLCVRCESKHAESCKCMACKEGSNEHGRERAGESKTYRCAVPMRAGDGPAQQQSDDGQTQVHSPMSRVNTHQYMRTQPKHEKTDRAQVPEDGARRAKQRCVPRQTAHKCVKRIQSAV